MRHRFTKLIEMDHGDDHPALGKGIYSYSIRSRLQRLQLFLKVHTGWRLQYLYTTMFKRSKENHFAYEHKFNDEKPLVYSCSGCSSAAQMANYLAVQLDRRGVAEMSCIAGVGGNVKKLVRTALSRRPLITIDGCPLACSRSCLSNHALKSAVHIELTSLGVTKKNHTDFDLKQAADLLQEVERRIVTWQIAEKQ